MLVEQRLSWHKDFQLGKVESVYLDQYRKIRESDSERMPVSLERLCEYIIWLEEENDYLYRNR